MNLRTYSVDNAPERVLKRHRELYPDTFERDVKWMQGHGAWYLDPAEYDDFGLDGDDRVGLLFGLGRCEELEGTVGIVGTRRADWYGIDMAGFLGRAVAEEGGVVVSGGAVGIDTAAHRGAVAGGGRSVVVLGSGLVRPYPATNKRLFDEIVEKEGCIITEIAPFAQTYPLNFARRNRIIAALSDAIIVVQAPLNSGAMITARWGFKLEKAVFTLPSDVIYENGAGNNRLLAEGAMVLTPEALFEWSGVRIKQWNRVKRRSEIGRPALKVKRKKSFLSRQEMLVYQAVMMGKKDVDSIAEETKLDGATVISTLSTLQIKGVVSSVGANWIIVEKIV